MRTSKPHWIAVEHLSIFNHKLFMADFASGHMGSCIPKDDGTFEWTHPLAKWNGNPVRPTHYWSF